MSRANNFRRCVLATQKPTGDKVEEPEVKTPETKEPRTLSPQEEADYLRNQLGELETKLTAAQEEAKAHQRVVSEKSKELQDAKGFRDEVFERLELSESMIAQLGDKDREGAQSFKQTLDAQKRAKLVSKGNEASVKVDELIRGTGLDKNSPELEIARMYFDRAGMTGNASDYDMAIRKTEEAVAKIKPKEGEEVDEKKETEEEKINKKVDEKLKEKMIEKGLLTPEGGEPSAAGGITLEQFNKEVASSTGGRN